MNKAFLSLSCLAICISFLVDNAFANEQQSCTEMRPICADESYVFQGLAGQTLLPSKEDNYFGCLTTQPNPI